eukprot:9166812-Lingulodinium_polyedra.AAC.1
MSELLELDIVRDPAHDLLEGPLYDSLCTRASQGRIALLLAGPNCRTVSILRHRPIRGPPCP